MKIILVFSFFVPLLSCLSPLDENEFFVSELIPKSGEFENELIVHIRFSKPLNKETLSSSDIQLVDVQNPESAVDISYYEIDEDGYGLTIFGENVEPDKYYRLLIRGNILSEDKRMLSYYYRGNFLSDDIYYIRKKDTINPCIVINEVMNYPSEDFDREFIEIFNCSESDIDLRGYYIKIDENRPQKLLFSHHSFNLSKGEYCIILSDVKEAVNEPLVYIAGKFGKNGLSNTTLKSIRLFDEKGRLLSEFKPSGKAKRGISYERINPFNKSNERNWGYSVSTTGSTPNRENSIFLKDIFPPSLKSAYVREEEKDMEIVMVFDEDMYCESVDCVYLMSQDNQRISGQVIIAQNSLTFIPLKALQYQADYTIFVNPFLKDMYGNAYETDTELLSVKTPKLPMLKLYYPSDNYIPANVRYFEFLSGSIDMDKQEVFFKGPIQRLDLLCVKSEGEGRYLCTISDTIQGPENMCLYINGDKTDICRQFVAPEKVSAPVLTISNFMQIKDYIYISAESSIPCLLFADFANKEDLDETFSYSTYMFSQHFEYKIRIQDPYKEYFVDVYCIDLYNELSEKFRYDTIGYDRNGDSIIINEILTNPEGADMLNEFIEIYNNGNSKVNTGFVSIGDCRESPIRINKMSAPYLLPGQLAIIVAKNSPFFSDNESCSVLSGQDKIIGRELKNNKAEMLCLYYNDTLMDVYNSSTIITKEGQSIKRIDKQLFFDPSNWKVSEVLGGTPCRDY